MRQLLLVAILIGGCAVQAQRKYHTQNFVNGVAWRTMSTSESLHYVVGVMEGAQLVFKGFAQTNATAPCTSRINVATSKWIHSTPGKLTDEVDAFYESAANIPVPAVGAIVYSLMKLGGASKLELEQYGKSLRTDAAN